MAELFTLLVLVSVGLAPVPAEPPPDPLGWGYLGVAPEAGGMRLAVVQPGTPAAKAGLQKGDELISVGTVAARDWQDITEYVCNTRPGTVIRVKVRRDGEEKSIPVRIGIRPPPSPDLPAPQFRRRLPAAPDR
ncbi:MAG TPA: PDZ domain-containing protein [Fimbriiglobus sp.]|jgi:serine protease Do|nr:PDZ domain-containing protein [Fimbriiglobus sp.]